MAVAGVIIQCIPGKPLEFADKIKANPTVVDIQPVPGQEGVPVGEEGLGPTLAAVLECRSDTIKGEMEKIKKLPFVLLLDMTYINYEDDLEAEGTIPCPPHERRERKRPL